MAMDGGLEYYAARAKQARLLAEKAYLPEVRQLHLDMAERYTRMVERVGARSTIDER